MQSLPQRLLKQMQRGFTLIELLIVVIILAILAAIVIPQFSSATLDAQEGALDANLANLRSAIELYKVQHKGKYPGDVITAATCSTGGTPGDGAAGEPQLLIDQLTMVTDANGGTCTIANPAKSVVLGPYLRKGIPDNPITQKGSAKEDITVTADATALAPKAAASGAGWAYSRVTGQIIMDSDGKDTKGTAYSSH